MTAPEPATAGGPRRRRTLALAALAVAGLLLALRVGSGGAAAPTFEARGLGRPLPTAQLEPVDLEAFEGILVGLRGTPVIVNVWASWCAPCRAEMPLLERAAATYEGRIVVLGVDSRDDPSAARRFLDDVRVTYPNVFDAGGRVRRALGLRGFPTTYFFDRSGRLVESIVGGVTEGRLAAQIRELAP